MRLSFRFRFRHQFGAHPTRVHFVNGSGPLRARTRQNERAAALPDLVEEFVDRLADPLQPSSLRHR